MDCDSSFGKASIERFTLDKFALATDLAFTKFTSGFQLLNRPLMTEASRTSLNLEGQSPGIKNEIAR